MNNIYLDTICLRNYSDNIIGNAERLKYRVRWYGENTETVSTPVLEVKKKQGELGTKALYPLRSFHLRDHNPRQAIRLALDHSGLPGGLFHNLYHHFPVLMNRYKRKYFQDADGKFRITIDTDQSFYLINNSPFASLNPCYSNASVILEIKYDAEYQMEASRVTDAFPFRLSKNSKYINGVDLLL